MHLFCWISINFTFSVQRLLCLYISWMWILGGEKQFGQFSISQHSHVKIILNLPNFHFSLSCAWVTFFKGIKILGSIFQLPFIKERNQKLSTTFKIMIFFCFLLKLAIRIFQILTCLETWLKTIFVQNMAYF